MKARTILIPAAVTAAAVNSLYSYVFLRRGSLLLNRLLETHKHSAEYYRTRDAAAAALREREQERWELRSDRGELLRGFYFPGTGERRRVAFIVHGYRSEHADTAGRFYDFYAARGFDLFCCDHAAHGESEGKYIGFAVREPDDCLKWLDALIRRLGPEVEIVLHGFSMGGATVLRMADRLPPQVKFVIEDSGFASAERQLRGQSGPLYPVLRLMNRLASGNDLRDGDTAPALSRARVPILFVHGTEDTTVPYRNGPALYEAYRGEKACLFVPGARHIESLFIDPEGYGREVDRMIKKYCK